jgi:hypothetical protein
MNHLDAGNLWWEGVKKPYSCRREQAAAGNINFKKAVSEFCLY